MTTDRTGLHVATAAAALALWFGGIVLVTAAADPARVVALAPHGVALAASLRAGARLVSVRGNASIVAAGAKRKRGFVLGLYAGGAWLVLPASAGGCVPGPAVP